MIQPIDGPGMFESRNWLANHGVYMGSAYPDCSIAAADAVVSSPEVLKYLFLGLHTDSPQGVGRVRANSKPEISKPDCKKKP